MKEVFYEECSLNQNAKSEKRKYNLLLSLSIVGFSLAGMWLIIALFLIDFNSGLLIVNILLLILPTVTFFAFGFVAFKFRNMFCIDYDYTFITGTIKIAKVTKFVKRQLLTTFDYSQIERIGSFGSDTYFEYASRDDISAQMFSSNKTESEGKRFMYIVVNSYGSKNIYVLEVTNEFIKNILAFTGKRVLEKEQL